MGKEETLTLEQASLRVRDGLIAFIDAGNMVRGNSVFRDAWSKAFGAAFRTLPDEIRKQIIIDDPLGLLKVTVAVTDKGLAEGVRDEERSTTTIQVPRFMFETALPKVGRTPADMTKDFERQHKGSVCKAEAATVRAEAMEERSHDCGNPDCPGGPWSDHCWEHRKKLLKTENTPGG